VAGRRIDPTGRIPDARFRCMACLDWRPHCDGSGHSRSSRRGLLLTVHHGQARALRTVRSRGGEVGWLRQPPAGVSSSIEGKARTKAYAALQICAVCPILARLPLWT
jgi:hypothetical protein